jgi:hypothetical protein
MSWLTKSQILVGPTTYLMVWIPNFDTHTNVVAEPNEGTGPEVKYSMDYLDLHARRGA